MLAYRDLTQLNNSGRALATAHDASVQMIDTSIALSG
jgi:hypothetical protein